HRAHAVPLGGLDFYDLGAEVAEDLSGVGSEDDRREIEDAQAFEEGDHWAWTGSVKERGGLPPSMSSATSTMGRAARQLTRACLLRLRSAGLSRRCAPYPHQQSSCGSGVWMWGASRPWSETFGPETFGPETFGPEGPGRWHPFRRGERSVATHRCGLGVERCGIGREAPVGRARVRAALGGAHHPHALVTAIAPNFPGAALSSPPSSKIKRAFVLFCAPQDPRRPI